jgi:ribonuclease BN (tRNA processing enzyme)
VVYQVDLDGAAVVFRGDVQEFSRPLVELAAGCDVFVCDMALPEREVARALNASPELPRTA